jgi:hypothetical protein
VSRAAGPFSRAFADIIMSPGGFAGDFFNCAVRPEQLPASHGLHRPVSFSRCRFCGLPWNRAGDRSGPIVRTTAHRGTFHLTRTFRI